MGEDGLASLQSSTPRTSSTVGRGSVLILLDIPSLMHAPIAAGAPLGSANPQSGILGASTVFRGMRLSFSDAPARAWRQHLNLTQAAVAKRMKVTQAAVAQFEAPGAKLRKVTRDKLAAALRLTGDQLAW